MKLRDASGGPEMIKALADQNVSSIVTMLLQILDEELFRNTTGFLAKFNQHTQPNFQEALEDLRISIQPYPDEQGLHITSEFVDALITKLNALYHRDATMVKFLRGAIVELLTIRLVSQHCSSGACHANKKFLNEQGRETTAQIDIAVLSRDDSYAEGYECKLKANGLMSEDCDNLRALVFAAHKEGYLVHVAVVSFVADEIIHRRLRFLQAPSYITAYGLDSITKLRDIPDYVEPDDSIEDW